VTESAGINRHIVGMRRKLGGMIPISRRASRRFVDIRHFASRGGKGKSEIRRHDTYFPLRFPLRNTRRSSSSVRGKLSMHIPDSPFLGETQGPMTGTQERKVDSDLLQLFNLPPC
jgi:hypothetical protein